MTTPDPTLAARLIELYDAVDATTGGIEYAMALHDTMRSGQLITLADAEAMVRDENEACALAVQPNGYQPECCRDTMSAIASAIRARVKP